MEESEKARSVAIIEAVREAVGPEMEIFIEMHGRFATHTAIEMCRRLAPYRPGCFEEPVPPENNAALLEVRRAVAPLGIPVASGERLYTRYRYNEKVIAAHPALDGFMDFWKPGREKRSSYQQAPVTRFARAIQAGRLPSSKRKFRLIRELFHGKNFSWKKFLPKTFFP